MFCSRLSFDLTPNRLSVAIARLRATHVEVTDLTESNPTAVGLVYPPRLLDALATPASLRYDPQPFGRPAARQAVVDDYRRRGCAVSRDRVVLTTSTSETYSLLFKLLCDPGDDVLVPVPSYPLFEHLASLDAVQVRPYALDFHGRWAYEVEAIKQATTPRTRAVIIVSPNNPTGSYLSSYHLGPLAAHCRAHDMAIIGDEVFAEYVLDVELPRVSSVLAQREALTFGLGGLSKSLGLPQLKLGWMVVNGPDALVKTSLERLEIMCDTYLSVSTPVQEALPTLLVEGAAIRSQIRDRVTRNYRSLMTLAAAYPSVTVLASEGGWCAVMQVPAMQSEESLVLRILEHDHVLVYPGFFFDFPREAFLIVSLLPAPDAFDGGIAKVLARVESGP